MMVRTAPHHLCITLHVWSIGIDTAATAQHGKPDRGRMYGEIGQRFRALVDHLQIITHFTQISIVVIFDLSPRTRRSVICSVIEIYCGRLMR
jgi:hypothetical protein